MMKTVSRISLKWLFSAALACLLLSAHQVQAAPACFVNGILSVNFGNVRVDENTDITAQLPYACQSDASPVYFTLCLYINNGSPISGVNPRYLTNFNGSQMAFDLYGDAARTQVLGPKGSFQPLMWTLLVPAGFQQPAQLQPVYGRVPGRQSGLSSVAQYESHIPNSPLDYAWSYTGFPSSCAAGNPGSVAYHTDIYALVPNTCNISAATDLAFGSVSNLNAAVNQTSAIDVRCPTGTAWNLGLDNGVHASGNTRRMMSGSNFVSYELYRDAARTQRWGNTVGADTVSGSGAGTSAPQVITVYGQVPAQSPAPTGGYSDMITVTLTY